MWIITAPLFFNIIILDLTWTKAGTTIQQDKNKFSTDRLGDYRYSIPPLKFALDLALKVTAAVE